MISASFLILSCHKYEKFFKSVIILNLHQAFKVFKLEHDRFKGIHYCTSWKTWSRMQVPSFLKFIYKNIYTFQINTHQTIMGLKCGKCKRMFYCSIKTWVSYSCYPGTWWLSINIMGLQNFVLSILSLNVHWK